VINLDDWLTPEEIELYYANVKAQPDWGCRNLGPEDYLDLQDVIVHAFSWTITPEGFDYWNEVAKR